MKIEIRKKGEWEEAKDRVLDLLRRRAEYYALRGATRLGSVVTSLYVDIQKMDR